MVDKLSAQTHCRFSVLDRKMSLAVVGKRRGLMLYYAVILLGVVEAQHRGCSLSPLATNWRYHCTHHWRNFWAPVAYRMLPVVDSHVLCHRESPFEEGQAGEDHWGQGEQAG